MPQFSFTATEHDADKPWLIVGTEHGTVEIEDAATFYDWAHNQFPSPRWTVELDPGQLTPGWLRAADRPGEEQQRPRRD